MRSIELARRTRVPVEIIAALTIGAVVFHYRREPARVRELASEALALAREHGLEVRASGAAVLLAVGAVAEGPTAEAAAALREAVRVFDRLRDESDLPLALPYLVAGCALVREADDALRLADEGLRIARDRDVGLWCPEFHRVRGEMLWRRSGGGGAARAAAAEAESEVRQAIAVARAQGARSFELRAAISLARMLGRGRRGRAAREELAAVSAGFTEGFDTPDLTEARALLGRAG